MLAALAELGRSALEAVMPVGPNIRISPGINSRRAEIPRDLNERCTRRLTTLDLHITPIIITGKRFENPTGAHADNMSTFLCRIFDSTNGLFSITRIAAGNKQRIAIDKMWNRIVTIYNEGNCKVVDKTACQQLSANG